MINYVSHAFKTSVNRKTSLIKNVEVWTK